MNAYFLKSFARHPWFYIGHWLTEAWCGLRGHGGIRKQYFWHDDPERGEPHWFCKRCGKEVQP